MPGSPYDYNPHAYHTSRDCCPNGIRLWIGPCPDISPGFVDESKPTQDVVYRMAAISVWWARDVTFQRRRRRRPKGKCKCATNGRQLSHRARHLILARMLRVTRTPRKMAYSRKRETSVPRSILWFMRATIAVTTTTCSLLRFAWLWAICKWRDLVVRVKRGQFVIFVYERMVQR